MQIPFPKAELAKNCVWEAKVGESRANQAGGSTMEIVYLAKLHVSGKSMILSNTRAAYSVHKAEIGNPAKIT